MATKSKPKAPKGLSRAAATFWRDVNEQFELEDHHRVLLEQACHCLDRIAQAKSAIDEQGILIADRFGQTKENPASHVEISNKRMFKALVRELGLDVAAVDEGYDRVRRLATHGRKQKGT